MQKRKPLDQGRISAILGSTIVTTARDWTEDFEHENGKYSNACLGCGQTFLGHKRRVACKECASKEATADAACDSIPEYPMATSRVDGYRYLAFTKIGEVTFRGESELGEKHATRDLMDRVSAWKAAQP